MLFQPVILAFLSMMNRSQSQNIAQNNYLQLLDSVIAFENLPPKSLNVLTCFAERHENNNYFKQIANKYKTTYKINFVLENSHLKNFDLFFVDISCGATALQLLELASKGGLFRSPYRWILVNVNENFDFSRLNFSLDSKVYVITPNIELSMIYKLTSSSELIKRVKVANWSNDQFLRYNVDLNRHNLEGTDLKISYVITHPDSLNHLWDYRDRHIDAISKMNYILVHHLVDFLNATQTKTIQPTWGYKNATTGIYSGMAGDLQTKAADLGGTPLFFTLDRVEIIDYIAATTPTFMKFIFRAPPLSYVTNVYTLPFDATVWHYSFIMIAIIGICTYVIVLWEWKDPEFQEKIKQQQNVIDQIPANIFDVFVMELGAITQQGTDKEPKSYAGRIATIFTFLVLMFMYTSYSANIVALLQSTTDSIRTLDDLLSSRIKLGAEDIVYAHYYFERAQEPVRKAIYQQKIAPKGQKPNFMTIEEGIRRVQGGFFAFHVELANGYKVVSDLFQENEKCGLREIEYVNLIEPWISAQKNSPYKEAMKIGLKKIVESGVRRREYNRIYTKKPVCQSMGSNFGSVGMIDCYSAFLIFAVGIIASILLLMLEVVAMRYAIKKRECHVQEIN